MPDDDSSPDAMPEPGDAADAADRLTRLMEEEAVEAALHGDPPGDRSLGAFDRPLEDLYDIAAAEGSDDASDDAFHAGGLEPDPWVTAEQAAMHVVDDGGRYLDARGQPVDDGRGPDLTEDDDVGG